MKLGIIGLPGSGKSTVFRALTGAEESQDRKGTAEPGLGVVKVEDPRLDFLAKHHKPKKVTEVHVEYLDIAGLTGEGKPGKEIGDRVLAHIRPLDALVHCVRFFDSPLLGDADPVRDAERVEEEMILSDMAIVEKRVERIRQEMKKGRKELAEELDLLEQAASYLGEGKPLRFFPPALESEKLRGFSFLSCKPELILLNCGEDKDQSRIDAVSASLGEVYEGQPHVEFDWLYADAEAEIARLDEEDARAFLQDLGLDRDAKSRIIRKSFDLLNLIVFLTAGEPEVRAWALREGSTALQAAGAIHSDIQRGFIRAEVVSFEDFEAAGSQAEVQKAGKLRLEGKEYRVQDGDIILFRFNV